ncbi:hypothetical protein M5D96_013397, partial [Drosophila gunungcola]
MMCRWRVKLLSRLRIHWISVLYCGWMSTSVTRFSLAYWMSRSPALRGLNNVVLIHFALPQLSIKEQKLVIDGAAARAECSRFISEMELAGLGQAIPLFCGLTSFR